MQGHLANQMISRSLPPSTSDPSAATYMLDGIIFGHKKLMANDE
jgi:hypothetical protein